MKINISKTLQNIKAHAEQYNVDKELDEQVRDNHIHLANYIYKFYAERHNAGKGQGTLKFNDNGAAIAACLNIHPKTLDNRMKRLTQAGIAKRLTPRDYSLKIKKAGVKSSEFIVEPTLLAYFPETVTQPSN